MVVACIVRPCVAFQQIGSRTFTSLNLHNPNLIAPFHYATNINARSSFSRLYSSSSDDDDSSSSSDVNGITKTRILFLGTPDVAATSLKSIHDESQTNPACPDELVGVVTQPPKRRKRKGKPMPSPVGLMAEELGIPVLCPEKARDKEFLDELEKDVKPDLCITAAYGQFLPKRFLATPKFGTLNIHPSLLPRWRGSSPVQRSLEAGDNPVGVSVLFTVSKMDAGPIVSQQTYDVDENEQATTLLPTLFDIGTKCLIEAIPRVIEGEITMESATVQDENEVAEAGMINPADAQLWPAKMSANEIHNRVRGFSMWPGTFIYIQMGDNPEPVKVKVIESRVLDETVDPTDGIELGPNKGDGLRLVCADGSVLEMLQVQPATKKVMDAKSFVNGLQGRAVRWMSGLEEENSSS